MHDEEKLLQEIERFVRRTGISERQVGKKSVNNHKLVETLRDGKTCTLRTARAVRDFMAANKG